MKTIACHHCKNTWSFEPPMGRSDCCPKCSNDSRVCKNCLFFDLSAYRSCREEQAEWVKEKDRGNFCGFFSARGSQAPDPVLNSARNKLDALFGSPSPQSSGAANKESGKPQAPDLTRDLEDFLKKRQK